MREFNYLKYAFPKESLGKYERILSEYINSDKFTSPDNNRVLGPDAINRINKLIKTYDDEITIALVLDLIGYAQMKNNVAG